MTKLPSLVNTEIGEAEQAADDAILTLSLSIKLQARKIRDLAKREEIDAMDATKMLCGLSDAAIKLGKRAEEITVKRLKEVKSKSTDELRLLSTAHSSEPRNITLPDGTKITVVSDEDPNYS